MALQVFVPHVYIEAQLYNMTEWVLSLVLSSVFKTLIFTWNVLWLSVYVPCNLSFENEQVIITKMMISYNILPLKTDFTKYLP